MLTVHALDRVVVPTFVGHRLYHHLAFSWIARTRIRAEKQELGVLLCVYVLVVEGERLHNPIQLLQNCIESLRCFLYFVIHTRYLRVYNIFDNMRLYETL